MDQQTWLNLYRHMYRSRLFEEHVVQIWNDGLITGEMHTGIGEEAINAGIIDHLTDGDALALDHRTSGPSIIRGLDPAKLLLEFMGHPEGLCSGMGGHMHVFSKPHLLASSGIVGASGPAAVGFALSARYCRPGKIAVSFFGEGASNQGMMMESFNMASSLQLPVLFVCKDNGMAITTQSAEVTGGKLIERAESFGMRALELDGTHAELVWKEANELVAGIRSGDGPAFLLAKCFRPQGHFLGDPLLRIKKKPVKELSQLTGPLIKSVTKIRGGTLNQRLNSLLKVASLLGKTVRSSSSDARDPLAVMRKNLEKHTQEVDGLELEVNKELEEVVKNVLKIFQKSNQV